MENDTHAGESFSPEEMVNASELREFLFCERAWFLGRRGFQVTVKAQSERTAGIAFHASRAAAASQGSSPKAYGWALLLAIAAITLLAATLWTRGL